MQTYAELDPGFARRRLKARRLAIMVRYQVEAVFQQVAEGLPTDRHDQSWIALLSDEDAVRLLRIFEALRRIDMGVYGQCASCGESIDHARLEATPEAHLCEVCSLFATCSTDVVH